MLKNAALVCALMGFGLCAYAGNTPPPKVKSPVNQGSPNKSGAFIVEQLQDGLAQCRLEWHGKHGRWHGRRKDRWWHRRRKNPLGRTSAVQAAAAAISSESRPPAT